MTISALMGALVQLLSDYSNKKIIVMVEDDHKTAYEINDLKDSGRYVTMTIEEA